MASAWPTDTCRRRASPSMNFRFENPHDWMHYQRYSQARKIDPKRSYKIKMVTTTEVAVAGAGCRWLLGCSAHAAALNLSCRTVVCWFVGACFTLHLSGQRYCFQQYDLDYEILKKSCIIHSILLNGRTLCSGYGHFWGPENVFLWIRL